MNTAVAAGRYDLFEPAEVYRGRAYHARLGAQEAPSENLRAIFERLAVSYDKLALQAEHRALTADAEQLRRRPDEFARAARAITGHLAHPPERVVSRLPDRPAEIAIAASVAPPQSEALPGELDQAIARLRAMSHAARAQMQSASTHPVPEQGPHAGHDAPLALEQGQTPVM